MASMVAIVMVLVIISLGAAWYLGLFPDNIGSGILDRIDDIEEAVPANVEDTIQDVIDNVEDTIQDGIASVGETSSDDMPVPDATAKVPNSPLDRTIYPNGTTHGSLQSTERQAVPAQQNQEPEVEHTPQPTKAEQIEDLIYSMTNQNREAMGRQPLDRIPKIDQIARSHSEDMAKRNYFEHDTPEGLDPTDRGNAAGYACRKDYGSHYTWGLAENIFWHSGEWYGAERLAEEIMEGWMDSPGHRQNIMNHNYDRIGIGVAIWNGNVYATQNFC